MMNYPTINFRKEIVIFIQQLDRSKVTKESYRRMLNSFDDYMKSNCLQCPKKEDIIVYKYYLKHEKSLSAATIQKVVVVLRGFFEYLALNEIYPNIMLGVRGEKISTNFKRSSLSIKQLQKLLDKSKKLAVDIEGKRNYAIISLIITTGLRTIEVERANRDDLSMKNDINILYIQGKGRDDKSDYVKLSDDVHQIIESYLLDRTDDNEALFVTHARNKKYSRLMTRSIRGIIKEYLRRINIDDSHYSAHSLRHSFATNLIKNGGSLEEAQLILRHKELSTTMIYNHALDRENSDGELVISDMLFKKGKK